MSTGKTWIAGLVAAGLIAGMVLANNLPVPADVDEGGAFYIRIKAAVTALNVLLSAALVFIYLKMYREIKSGFTFSLLLITAVMLVYSITSNPLLHILWGYCLRGLGPFTVAPDVFAAVALSTLLYISTE